MRLCPGQTQLPLLCKCSFVPCFLMSIGGSSAQDGQQEAWEDRGIPSSCSQLCMLPSPLRGESTDTSSKSAGVMSSLLYTSCLSWWTCVCLRVPQQILCRFHKIWSPLEKSCFTKAVLATAHGSIPTTIIHLPPASVSLYSSLLSSQPQSPECAPQPLLVSLSHISAFLPVAPLFTAGALEPFEEFHKGTSMANPCLWLSGARQAFPQSEVVLKRASGGSFGAHM